MKKSALIKISLVVFLFGFMAILGKTSSSQVKTSDRPAFAVTSVKPNGSAGEIPGPPAETSNYFAWHGRTLKTLTCYAYGVRDWQIVGAPDWFDSQLWDVEGKADQKDVDAEANPGDKKARHTRLMLMLQSLLENRFSLKARRQTKQSPVYNLVVAKGGLKIKRDENQSPPSQNELESRSKESWEMPRGTISIRRIYPSKYSIEGRAVPIERLLTTLRNLSDRPIIDRTNLKASYNFKIEWSEVSSAGVGTPPLARKDLSLGPAFLQALQEQLGLRLESSTGPVEFLVITSIQREPGK